MTESGVILDDQSGMTHIACTVDAVSGADRAHAARTPAGKFATAAGIFPRHVLVVDDEPLIRWSVSESLAELGFDVEQAADAGSALRTVTTTAEPFDAIVLDLRLPDMDDLSLVATLRQLVPRAVMILMTAFGTPEIIAGAETLGVVVINKPFELDELKRLVIGPSRETL